MQRDQTLTLTLRKSFLKPHTFYGVSSRHSYSCSTNTPGCRALNSSAWLRDSQQHRRYCLHYLAVRYGSFEISTLLSI